MGGGKKNKRSRPKQEKPLLSITGILHLQKSFVPPTEQNQLLTTVEGEQQFHQQHGVGDPGGGGSNFGALVLAPNYGYGIPASFVTQLQKEQEELKAMEPPPNLVQVNGIPTYTNDKNVVELNQDFPSFDKLTRVKEPENLSIAELVRSIGGAKDVPFYRSDVVDDTANQPNSSSSSATTTTTPTEDQKTNNDDDNPEIQSQDQEFYESLGISRPIPPAPSSSQSTQVTDSTPATTANASQVSTDQNILLESQIPPAEQDKNVTESIKDYYKTYCHYYFSSVPDPYGDQPVEFGHAIKPSDNKTDSSSQDAQPDQSIIELARMAQKARRAMEAAQLATKQVFGPHLPPSISTSTEETSIYDPLPMEIVPSGTTENLNITKDTSMEQYWEYVKESPCDFNRWCYLIQHAENVKNISECRKAYSIFLPLFPYCFGYWKRYSELEKGHLYFHRALAILQRGLEFNPLSIDLWLTYLSLFGELHGHEIDFGTNMREQYEKALDCAGLEYRSDSLWDSYIDWEYSQNNLRNVFTIYRRLLRVPTRLYNRYWDNFKALVRDHHPRDFLYKEEYELLRKKGCKALKFKYREEPEVEPGEIVKTSKPEDKLMAYVKERIITKLEKTHNTCVIEADKRWDFEDRIRRPYFHTKPLDKGQLRNWEDYLNFEMSEKDHDRIVLLFERSLIVCALYEQFWCKYARYLELYHRKESHAKENVSVHFQKSAINFQIAATTIQNKEIEEEEAIVDAVTELLGEMVNIIVEEEEKELKIVQDVISSIVQQVCSTTEENCDISDKINLNSDKSDLIMVGSNNVSDELVETVNCSGVLSGQSIQACSSKSVSPNTVEQNDNNNGNNANRSEASSSFSSLLSVPAFPPGQYALHEAVRDVYVRASIVHCPDKPVIRLQWAAFEEEIGNVKEARDLVRQVIEWYPDLAVAKAHLLELERRAGNSEQLTTLFERFLKKAKKVNEFSSMSMKYARYMHKELGKSDKALAILRKAIKKDKGNHLLYNSVFEICHERFPADRKGAAASLELALQCKEIKNEYKLQFLKKKIHFLQEHGDLRRYRDAIDQLNEMQDIIRKEKLAEEKANPKQPIALPNANFVMEPFPVWSTGGKSTSKAVPINFESLDDNVDASSSTSAPNKRRATIDDPSAMDDKDRKRGKYQEVPPTEELVFEQSGYGYGRAHPDSILQERLSHQEYDNLVAQGYSDEIKDNNKEDHTEYIVPPRHHHPNKKFYNSNSRYNNNNNDNYNNRRKQQQAERIPTYIIPPKGTYLMNYLLKPKK